MKQTDNVLDLLDHLKTLGFSPGDRAKVLSEWCKFDTFFISPPNHDNVTPLHTARRELGDRVKDILWGLTSPEDLKKNVYRYENAPIARAFALSFGLDPEPGVTPEKLELLKNNIGPLCDGRVGSQWSQKDVIDIATGSTPPDLWYTIDQMEMDEDDLAVMIEKKSPQPRPEHPLPKNMDLNGALKELETSCQRASIPVCALDSLTRINPSAVYALAQSLNTMCDAYEQLGVPQPGLNGVDLNVVAPYEDGCSGFMQPAPSHSVMCPNKKPYVSISSRCGWESSEVLTHEYLHAHDAVFFSVQDSQNDTESPRSLLSDHPELKGDLARAWSGLAATLDQLSTDQDVAQKKAQARQGISARWASLGIDPDQLELAVQEWEATDQKTTNHKKRDERFLDHIKNLFIKTPFASSAHFRANVILAECKLLDQMDQSPVHHQFLKKFDDLYIDDKTKPNSYGRGYFEELSEEMARSIQLTLDTLPGQEQPENPYVKRWLVYPDQSLAHQTTKAWQAFFALPCVQEAYQVMREASPTMTNVKEKLLAIRSAKTQDGQSLTNKKALTS